MTIPRNWLLRNFGRRVAAKLGRPGLAKQPSPSLLLRAFAAARDAIQRIAQARPLTPIAPNFDCRLFHIYERQ
jgi:hypothetical protein